MRRTSPTADSHHLDTSMQRSSGPASGGQSISLVVKDLRDVAANRDTVSVQALLDSLGNVSHTGLMLLPALIAATPLSGIPGLTALCGLIIALTAAQILFGRETLWLPGWILRRDVASDDLLSALDKTDGVVRFLDRHAYSRFPIFVRTPMPTIITLVCLLCGLTMPFLEFLPFTGSLIGATVALLGISLLSKDGLFAVAGLTFLGAAAATILVLVT